MAGLHYNHVGGSKGDANNRHLTPEELDNNIGGLAVTEPKLRELFNQLDTSGNGYLSVDELKAWMKVQEHYGLEPTDEQLVRRIRQYHPGTGEVGFEEFAAIVLHLARY